MGAAAGRHARCRAGCYAAGPAEQAVTNPAMGFDPTQQQARMAGDGSDDGVGAVLARSLAGRTWVAGNRLSAADVVLGLQVRWGTAR